MNNWYEEHKQKFEERKNELSSDGIRNEFQRDIHRIMYSDAFRRLRHKTQVFFIPNNDHICTRMEHVLHVAEASSTVARKLNLNDDLTRAIALGHDLGHAPFGHHGESVLSEIMKTHNIGSGVFSHEVHGLKVVDKIAQLDRQTGPGINLTYAVRDGIISHCGEDLSNNISPSEPNKKLEKIFDKKKAGLPISYEGCIVRITDKIVYVGRDIEDALKAKLFTEDDINSELHDIQKILGNVNGQIVGKLIGNLIENGKKNEIKLSDDFDIALKKLIDWNYNHIYKTEIVEKYKTQTTRGVIKLFEQLVEDLESTAGLTKNEEQLPKITIYETLNEFINHVDYQKTEDYKIIVLDFIAGMTDNYLMDCISEMFLPKPIT
jgi:dGTPase